MQYYLLNTYYIFLVLGVVLGIINYKKSDSPMKVFISLLVITLIAEFISYKLYNAKKYEEKNSAYHIYNVIEAVIITTYFLRLYYLPKRKLLLYLSLIIWPVIGIMNMLFLQPITELNNNMLILESFAIITMSLYSIHRIVKNSYLHNIFNYAHFWLAVVLLIGWSSTFFFWAFIKVLYGNDWPYIDIVLNMHIIICILVYAGIATVLFFYPKMKKLEYR